MGASAKQALVLCFWGESKSADGERRGEMTQAYCHKHGIGYYDERFIDHESPTYGGELLSGA